MYGVKLYTIFGHFEQQLSGLGIVNLSNLILCISQFYQVSELTWNLQDSFLVSQKLQDIYDNISHKNVDIVTGFDIAEDVARAEGHEVDGEKTTVSSSTVTTDDWKSCAICLEEMPENELMVHTTCGGTFCSACLEVPLFCCIIDVRMWF